MNIKKQCNKNLHEEVNISNIYYSTKRSMCLSLWELLDFDTATEL